MPLLNFIFKRWVSGVILLLGFEYLEKAYDWTIGQVGPDSYLGHLIVGISIAVTPFLLGLAIKKMETGNGIWDDLKTQSPKIPLGFTFRWAIVTMSWLTLFIVIDKLPYRQNEVDPTPSDDNLVWIMLSGIIVSTIGLWVWHRKHSVGQPEDPIPGWP